MPEACLQNRITHADFISNIGRQRMRYYFPSADAIEKLERIGYDADQLMVAYGSGETNLLNAYNKFPTNLKDALLTQNANEVTPFVFGTQR